VDDVQWVPVIATLRNGRRPVLDGQTVASVFGADWPSLRRRVTAKIRTASNAWDESADYQVVATVALITNGMVFGSHWFGSPKWAGIVDDYVGLLGEGNQFRDTLLNEPDTLSTDVWKRLVDRRYDVGRNMLGTTQ
jgi:hypothetical protein